MQLSAQPYVLKCPPLIAVGELTVPDWQSLSLRQSRLKLFMRVTLPLACVRPMGELGALLKVDESVSWQTQTFSSGIAENPQVNS